MGDEIQFVRKGEELTNGNTAARRKKEWYSENGWAITKSEFSLSNYLAQSRVLAALNSAKYKSFVNRIQKSCAAYSLTTASHGAFEQ